MKSPLTYSQNFTSINIGGYRYFFNGQEGDNEVFGEMANFGYEFRQYDSRIGRWWSVDPKWNEYPSVSPFVFCNGSPIIMMDPKGEDPIYKKKFFGGVKKIGDDGKCGTGSYLVKGEKARDVKAATKSGEFYTGDLSIGKNVIHIPTGEIQRGVQETVELTQKSGDSPDTRIEYGGHSLYGDVKARLWDPGSPTQISKLEDGTIKKMRTVTPFKIGGKNYQIGGPPQTVEFIWHVHTYSSKPSYRDFNEIKDWINGGFSGNAFVVSENDNTVSFYNLTKVILKISYTDFIRMGNQEDIP